MSGNLHSGPDPLWTLAYHGFDPAEEGRREALCTLGNGRFATRGAAVEAGADGTHYPGTYIAGGYDRLVSAVAGRNIENEDLVNFPNWLPVRFRPEGGDWAQWGDMDVDDYAVELRLREGVLHRRYRIRDDAGRETAVAERRIVHMRNPELAGLEYRIRPLNWTGRLCIESAIDGGVRNAGVARYRDLASKHLQTMDRGGVDPEGIHLLVRTVQSHLEVAVAARTRFLRGGERTRPERTLDAAPEHVAERAWLEVGKGEELVVEKVVTIHTSRDHAVSAAGEDARRSISRLPSFVRLLRSHALAWEALWRRFDMTISLPHRTEAEAARIQLILRLHVFHLLQTCSLHTAGLDVGVPARGWHGEAYRGHVFWDEIFVLPLYDLHIPEVARSLLLYRYRRLEEAKAHAREEGFRGALFPWQSGSNGREETQVVHLNPRSGEWGPDHSRLQRHINAAIAYNVHQYYETTGDLQFMRRYGGEMLLEIARFWSSAAEFDTERGRWVIRGVMGPDEYQERYPGSSRGGVDNNAYTNVMAVWCLETALEAIELVGEPRAEDLRQALELTDEELERWQAITRRMFVPFMADGVIEQFEGYAELEEFDWEGYRERYGDIQRLDRILEAEGDTPDRYKASKQADATMLFHLLSCSQLAGLLGRLGYEFDEERLARTVEYYRRRSSHGSTLSRVVYASVLNLVDQEEGWRLFQEALGSDVDDVQGGTTAEGIHLGAMAGTVDMVLRRYAGLRVIGGRIHFEPCVPPEPLGLRFHVEHRHEWLEVDLAPERLRLALDATARHPLEVCVRGEEARLEPGIAREFPIPSDGCD